MKGGRAGNVFVTVRVTPDQHSAATGRTSTARRKPPSAEAAPCGSESVPTVDSEVEVKIPAGTQPGAVLRLEGKGATEPAPPEERGKVPT